VRAPSGRGRGRPKKDAKTTTGGGAMNSGGTATGAHVSLPMAASALAREITDADTKQAVALREQLLSGGGGDGGDDDDDDDDEDFDAADM